MNDLDCLFRSKVRKSSDAEVACCTWLQQITGADEETCTVSRSACEACIASSVVDPLRWNRVLPSLVYEVCNQALGHADSAARADRLRELNARAEQAILCDDNHWIPDRIAACDVVMICRNRSAATVAAIDSVLAQADAVIILHLLLVGDAQTMQAKYAGHWNVRMHLVAQVSSYVSATHDLIESLETSYVGFQTEDTVSHPRRFADSVAAIERDGSEWFVAPVRVDSNLSVNADFAKENFSTAGEKRPGGGNPGTAQELPDGLVETIVFRRATFIDLGGAAERRRADQSDSNYLDDAEPNRVDPAVDFEFIDRAVYQKRPFSIGAKPTVASIDAGELRSSRERTKELRAAVGTGFAGFRPRDFPVASVACDVVLPFYGHFDFVSEAIESVLAQENADVVIHLIDDASPDDATDLLDFWKRHPSVRAYRHRENVGQFASFNNASAFFETNLAAVQDADDISLPSRLSIAGNLLRLSAADFFGGGVELFGDDTMIRPTNRSDSNGQRAVETRAEHRYASYPNMRRVNYFVENPTAVFRTDMFRRFGGYADFGDRITNRASLDTEFLMRSLFAGANFAISQQIVAKYRVHSESATQNDISGWGSIARTKSTELVAQRAQIYRKRRFDPRLFGALGRSPNVIERI